MFYAMKQFVGVLPHALLLLFYRSVRAPPFFCWGFNNPVPDFCLLEHEEVFLFGDNGRHLQVASSIFLFSLLRFPMGTGERERPHYPPVDRLSSSILARGAFCARHLPLRCVRFPTSLFHPDLAILFGELL